MTTMENRPDIAAKLRDKAERENRSVDDVLDDFLSNSTAVKDEQSEMRRSMRAKFYKRARRYWEEVGDLERLALTDQQLDDQFWLFDTEGIPRLKSEQGTIILPDDPLVEIAREAERNNWHSGRSDISENFDAYLKEITPKPHD